MEELHLRQSLATQMGGLENLARHKAAGKLNVRERIDKPPPLLRSEESALSVEVTARSAPCKAIIRISGK